MQISHLTSFLLGLLTTSSQALPNPNHARDTRSATCANAGISAARAQQVSSGFSSAKLSPQFLPVFQPKVQVKAAYGSKAMNLGNVFSTAETISSPSITFSAETEYDAQETKYSILLVDPDAPSPNPDGTPALLSPFLHLAIYDASPDCVSSANYGGGTTLAMYKPLTPLSVANHRYVQLVYRQPPGKFTPPASISYVAGAKFDLNGFVSQGGLTLVGGNYFLEGLGSLGAVGK